SCGVGTAAQPKPVGLDPTEFPRRQRSNVRNLYVPRKCSDCKIGPRDWRFQLDQEGIESLTGQTAWSFTEEEDPPWTLQRQIGSRDASSSPVPLPLVPQL